MIEPAMDDAIGQSHGSAPVVERCERAGFWAMDHFRDSRAKPSKMERSMACRSPRFRAEPTSHPHRRRGIFSAL
jgi:hypothetical protein